jgi:hypothetical protein
MQCCMVTPNVRKDGIGDADPARVARGIGILVKGFQLPSTPQASATFNGSYLPPQKDRLLK